MSSNRDAARTVEGLGQGVGGLGGLGKERPHDGVTHGQVADTLRVAVDGGACREG